MTRLERFFRQRAFSRIRHRLTGLGGGAFLTKGHAALIRLSGGRIRRSFAFTGGMPVLVLTTTGRRSGQKRSIPLGYMPHGESYAVIASNAGSDRHPAWWLNLQADPNAEVLADGIRRTVRARAADPAEDATLWKEFARLNPGYDEYRRLTERQLPVVLLEPKA